MTHQHKQRLSHALRTWAQGRLLTDPAYFVRNGRKGGQTRLRKQEQPE